MENKFIELKKEGGGFFFVEINSIYMLRPGKNTALTDVYIRGFVSNGYCYLTAEIPYEEAKAAISQ